ncbi:peptide ABC transporter substrate-binding protein [Bacillus sp. ISL-18]|uniref:peptide ABC transporter substrate-binding protein n=1 Tax=Bacillus sp. ISL-18 TaxID=2819118 RepID=UPI001BECDDA3|nr:peptide ABC transporter substrate-binding protein [Bacillus sp. ISL-18]MBT2657259.1 peptide ABC transporter substrate-binding protein [Bacillus sp. ISL-18]
MKKNIILILSSLLILSMFLSIFYAAFFHKNNNVLNQSDENVQKDLRINIGSEPQSLHPGLADDSTSGSVLSQAFEGLTRKNVWGITVNAAAKVIKISDDLKTYTFTLRDAKWTNGDPVVAQDFEYAWKWVLDPANKAENAYQLYDIKGAKAYHDGKGSKSDVGIRALDDHTLEVELNQPNSHFLELATLSTYFPINRKVAMAHPSWANEVGKYYITNGPYTITKWNHNKEISFEKNMNYWDAPKVKIESISMQMVNDSTKALSMYENGDLDVMVAATTKTKEDDQDLYAHSLTGLYKLVINTEAKPFTNKNIRKALAFAINRQELADHSGLDEVEPAMAVIPPVLFPENKNRYFQDHDITKAKQYLQTGLKELGYNDVSALPVITLSFNGSESDERMAQTIVDMWKENLGVKVKLDSSALNTQNKQETKKSFDVSLIMSVNDYNDTLHILEQNTHSLFNRTGWDNKQFESMVEQSKMNMDKNQRLELIQRAESVLMDEMPIIPINFTTTEIIQDSNLHDIAINNQGNLQFRWAWFE